MVIAAVQGEDVFGGGVNLRTIPSQQFQDSVKLQIYHNSPLQEYLIYGWTDVQASEMSGICGKRALGLYEQGFRID